jgi:hypothetical protein
VGQTDADLQDSPGVILTLLHELGRSHAAEFSAHRVCRQSPLRILMSHKFRSLLGALVGLPHEVGVFALTKHTMVERLVA